MIKRIKQFIERFEVDYSTATETKVIFRIQLTTRFNATQFCVVVWDHGIYITYIKENYYHG